ncbi:uncharacterized protein LOC117240645 isoform X2 [Bombus vosnesenskii]|uniref:Uncharacterized protein LOC117240645 isoform X2 n=1 Tax=Bombus vosnesenskii TaxID=207650 RepID=A0A6J3LF88_9HYME|nr:uncharacterized protein LOC117240645 isoform X2 [Bombus vosnesenskii]XP_050493004.1 uncharacterized protein LOC126874699 [Bombus huntii]XP_050493005.1 uncharacterized protein LOC126874699 [Bombus huntii]
MHCVMDLIQGISPLPVMRFTPQEHPVFSKYSCVCDCATVWKIVLAENWREKRETLFSNYKENVTSTYNVIHSYGNNVRNEEARKSGGRASVKLDSLWSAASETNTLETLSLQKTSYRKIEGNKNVPNLYLFGHLKF